MDVCCPCSPVRSNGSFDFVVQESLKSIIRLDRYTYVYTPSLSSQILRVHLDLNGSRWNLPEMEVQRRRHLFWQLFHMDTWGVRDHLNQALRTTLRVEIFRVFTLVGHLSCQPPIQTFLHPTVMIHGLPPMQKRRQHVVWIDHV